MVLKDLRWFSLFLILTASFFWLLLYLPVWRIPGNDLRFQLSLLSPVDFGLLAGLSILTALSLVMNVYLLRIHFSPDTGLSAVGQSGLGGIAGVIASVFGTASCATCVASLFGFLGFGSVLFLLQYRQWITTLAILLMIVSLYFTARKVLGICAVCRVDYHKSR